MMNKIFQNRYFQILSLLIISLLVYYGLPIHQDEFINYFSLKYLDDSFKEATFNYGYKSYVKRIPFTEIFMFQPYSYAGIIQSVLFYPFYKIFNLIIANFFFKSLMLFLIIHLSKIVFRINSYWPFLLFPPLIITTIHDSGPINITLITMLSITIIIRYIFESQKNLKSTGAFLLIIFLLLLSLFDKIFIIYLIPGIFFFSIAGIKIHKDNMYKFYSFCLILILFLTYAFIFQNTGIQIRNYWIEQPADVIQNFYEKMNLISIFSNRLHTIKKIIQSLDYSFYLYRNLDVIEYFKFYAIGPIALLTLIISIIILVIYLVKLFINSMISKDILNVSFHVNNKILLYTISFIAFIGTFILLGSIAYPHHTIFLFYPLFGIYFHLSKENKIRFYATVLHLTFTILLFYRIYISKPHDYNNLSYFKVHEILENQNKLNNGKQIVNFSSWSYYFIESLQKNSIVTWAPIISDIQLNRLANLCTQKKCVLINVFNKSSEYPNMELEEQKNIVFKYFKKCTILIQTNNYMICQFE